MSRFDYVAYDGSAASMQEAAKVQVQGVESIINQLPDGRAKSLAITKLEESYMWIGKAIRDDQIKRSGSAPANERREPPPSRL